MFWVNLECLFCCFYFDLIGLLFMLEEIDCFFVDLFDEVYEVLVDDLFSCDVFGEWLVVDWFDVVCYLDFYGY